VRVPVDYFVRPMQPADVADAHVIPLDQIHHLDVRTHRTGQPEPEPRGPENSARWRARLAHIQRTDPAGCFVAEDRSGILGVVAGIRRELTWVLSTYAVRPDVQGRGVGRQLLEAAMAHGSGCLRAMLSATDDPAALRRYRLAGFALHPMMVLRGRVPREALPVVERVREGSTGDVDLMNSVDRQVRDAAHGPDHELLTESYRLVVVDRPTGSGYAYVDHGGGPYLLAATNRRTATDLLWETLAATDPATPIEVGHVTAANQWALDVGMACRLELWTEGYLGVRDMRPPAPYLPSAHFL